MAVNTVNIMAARTQIFYSELILTDCYTNSFSNFQPNPFIVRRINKITNACIMQLENLKQSCLKLADYRLKVKTPQTKPSVQCEDLPVFKTRNKE